MDAHISLNAFRQALDNAAGFNSMCRWKQKATAEHIKFHPVKKKKKQKKTNTAPRHPNKTRLMAAFWSIKAAVSRVLLPLQQHNEFLPV